MRVLNIVLHLEMRSPGLTGLQFRCYGGIEGNQIQYDKILDRFEIV